MNPLWYGTSGPHDADIVLVGEAWGADEAAEQKPFVGSSGTELSRILSECGIDRNKILMTNVVATRPANNEMWRLFHGKDTNTECVRGLYPTDFVVQEMSRLDLQIKSFPRKLVIVCGNYALWATSDHTGHNTPADTEGRRVPTGIMSWRGSMCYVRGTTIPLLPIIHPAAIMRQWSLRAITVHDLKTRVPYALKSDWRPAEAPSFLAPPTLQQIKDVVGFWIGSANAGPVEIVCDIETYKQKIITAIGLSDGPSFGMAIPFVRPVAGKSLDNYWTPEEEIEIARILFRLFNHKNIRWIGQNFLYDIQFIKLEYGVDLPLWWDTMLAQHLLFPGQPKSLDYVASLYNKYYWYWKEDGKEWDLKLNINQLLEYNCMDLIHTFEAYREQQNFIRVSGMENLWLERKANHNLALRMMNRGVKIDTEARRKIGFELMEKSGGISAWLESVVPQSWVDEIGKAKTKSSTPWYRSPSQQKTLFGDILGLRIPNHRQTGRPTLGKEALKSLPEKYPHLTRLFDHLEALRSVDVFYSHFVKANLEHNNRMRCSFGPGGTETFRWNSSKNPFGRGTNLQNVPEGTKEQ